MKQTLTYLSTGAALALLLLVAACDSGLDDLNEDPNQPATTRTPFLLTAAQTDISDNYWGSFELGYFGNLYAQYWSQNQYTTESRYLYREGVVNSTWEDYYVALNDLQEIIRLARANPETVGLDGAPQNQIAVAKIMQAWTFQVMTDIWGAIPFTDALQGRDNLAPAYTPQEQIYPALITLLTEATDSLDVTQPGFVEGDVIYGGDMERWRRFANSLKMRIALRMADQLPAEAGAAIQEALAAGPMQGNEDNALFAFSAAPPFQNPIYESYNVSGRDDFAVSEPLVDVMTATAVPDPRLASYAAPAEVNDQYVGFAYGLADGLAAAVPRNAFSRPDEALRNDPTAPCIWMLYDETLFIQAEAASRGLITGDAAALYEAAIQASMAYWGVTDAAAVDAFIAAVPFDETNLARQKWVALYMQGVQGWAEWRRLDFGGILVPPASGKLIEFEGDIPVRWPYPTDEQSLNAANLEAAVAGLANGDNQGSRVWWDVD